MNILSNSARAASSAAQRLPSFLVQAAGANFASSRVTMGSREPRKTSGVSAMSYYGKARTRVPYATALYAAAMAALVSACGKADVTPAPEAAIIQPAAEQGVDTSDLPTVVITAARERPKAIG